MKQTMDIGAACLGGNRCRFRVWAPLAQEAAVRLLSPRDRLVPMGKEEKGYYSVTLEDVPPGSQYLYRLDEQERPDPCSRFQADTVHGPSQVVDPHFEWQDWDWTGIPLEDCIFYELHVGTFTPEGTFDAVIPRIAQLNELGITNIEIMPVAQFPGGRNWGYDGVLPFAVQNTYGGPEGLKRLINACHRQQMGVTLDVVYNHMGPEGNYLREFGPYFTARHKTPWGEALNYDDAFSDEVRHYFICNALYWLSEYHMDVLRLDAVHAIYDFSAVPFLQEMAAQVDDLCLQNGKRHFLIAESDLNDTRLIRPRTAWGCGLDAQWSDDFHHCVHALLTGERDGYYADFQNFDALETAFNEAFIYSGGYSEFRKRRHGNFAADLPPEQFVVAVQNHDQVGNRMLGDRLSGILSLEAQKTAAALLILSPYLPLLFMGQEYGETAPFLYFISHSDPELTAAVRKGRREEFSSFGWLEEPPDPASEETFQRSKLHWELRTSGLHAILNNFYRELIHLRREQPSLHHSAREGIQAKAFGKHRLLAVHRKYCEHRALVIFSLDDEPIRLAPVELQAQSGWQKIMDSSDARWGGKGATLPDQWPATGSVDIPAFSASIFVQQ